MNEWFVATFVATGRVPLLCFFTGMIVGFGFIRLSVRLIRAEVRWWPGNITPGGLHIHHVVFGVVFMLVGGVAGLVVPDGEPVWRAVVAALFGVGSALVLDEFALILHLSDVYWSEKGRVSVDAVFVAIALTGLMLLGFRPGPVDDLGALAPADGDGMVTVIVVLDLLLAVVTLLKGKIWAGLIGVFIPVLIVVGAVRLARPHSPWARWRYRGSGRKLTKALWRERKLREPVVRAKIWVQELIAGRHEREPH
ncbi:hypothetical protein [Amycolatopsis nigrescens]|uniref:hypothetical protein n=1 Tax=Amycolatopsis nigrescens TaxID=381445 RepID=UPI000477A7FD|nr:hypothetical protein [Amycolatopsis nigrescens]